LWQLGAKVADEIGVQEADLNCGNLITPNQKRKPFDDVRVRRALTLAIDRWNGAPSLAKIAVVKTVGMAFPASPLAATKEELERLAGFWPDIEKSRAVARRLLKAAGAEGLSFEFLNRDLDNPFKYLGTWLVDEWSKVGLRVTQRILPTGPWFETMRTGNFDVTSALIKLASAAKRSPPTSPSAMQRRTVVSNSLRRRSQSRKRPCRFFEKVE
jgi:peptide/nickel transport system substrate-binding protein